MLSIEGRKRNEDWLAGVEHMKHLGRQALLRMFEGTYDLVDGKRVCRICHAEQHDFINGHAPGCGLAQAFADAIRILGGP